MDEHFIEKIKPIFARARKDLYYPPIVKLEPAKIETIEIAFSAPKYKILVGEGMVDKFSREALLGIFHHELNHWVKHPYDIKTLILENYWLGDIAGKEEIRNLFDDVVINLDLIINRGLGQIARAYREQPVKNKIDRLLRVFYSRVTGMDFGCPRPGAELECRISNLLAIDFLDRRRVRLKNNIRRFAEILKDLLDKKIELPSVFFSLNDFGAEGIIRAMEDIAREVTPLVYREIVETVRNRFDDSWGPPLKSRSEGKVISPGTKHLIRQLEKPDVGWYRNRAVRYSIYIESLINKGSLYPDQITDFEIDDSIDTFNPIESYGKLLPSLAKKYELSEFERFGEILVPDVVIIIDSSGSMPDPEQVVSYAVLGAFAIARNYFELGAKVGVINFSNVNLELEPTRTRQSVYEMLKTYQGHGTTLHIDDMHQYLSSIRGREKDYILITDAGIDNIRKVVDYMTGIKGRLTIIWLKSEREPDKIFKENFQLFKDKLSSDVTFVDIAHERDILRIAVGKIVREVYEINSKTDRK